MTGKDFTSTMRNASSYFSMLEPFMDMLVTDVFFFAIPEAVQLYGQGRKVDVTFNMAEEAF